MGNELEDLRCRGKSLELSNNLVSGRGQALGQERRLGNVHIGLTLLSTNWRRCGLRLVLRLMLRES